MTDFYVEKITVLKTLQKTIAKLLRTSFADGEFLLNKVFPLSHSERQGMQLLGSVYGGWHLPHSFVPSDTDIIYCIGAGEDISFDCALASNYPCPVYVVDPTPKAFKHYREVAMQVQVGSLGGDDSTFYYDVTVDDFKKLVFLPVGVSHVSGRRKFYFPENPDHVSCSTENIQNTNSYFEAECYSINDLLVKNKHKIPYLIKMDIEGAEYTVLKNMVEDNILPKFLAVEFHRVLSDTSNNIFHDTIVMLKNSGMNCIHVNWPDVVFMREG